MIKSKNELGFDGEARGERADFRPSLPFFFNGDGYGLSNSPPIKARALDAAMSISLHIGRPWSGAGDDAIKVYRDLVIRNVTIEQRRNVAPIQFGWGGESGHAKAEIENLVIKGASKDGLHNMDTFAWAGGSNGVRVVAIKGLKVDLAGKLYDESAHRWVPAGLFELNPAQFTLNLTATGAEIGHLEPGIRRTRGTVRINGRTLP